LRLQVAQVHALDAQHAAVLPDLGVHLAIANVHAIHLHPQNARRAGVLWVLL
jgi:hypothetical protein